MLIGLFLFFYYVLVLFQHWYTIIPVLKFVLHVILNLGDQYQKRRRNNHMTKKIRKYLLSHHLPKDYDRCFLIKIKNKNYRICARCSGWYLSFLMFWILLLFNVNFLLNYKFIILYFFPIPAILDWILHQFRIFKGTNVLRFLTGILIGLTFAMLLYTFIKNPFDIHFWFVSIIYVTLVSIVLKCSL